MMIFLMIIDFNCCLSLMLASNPKSIITDFHCAIVVCGLWSVFWECVCVRACQLSHFWHDKALSYGTTVPKCQAKYKQAAYISLNYKT